MKQKRKYKENIIYCENKNMVEDDSQVGFSETSFVRKMLIFKSNWGNKYKIDSKI